MIIPILIWIFLSIFRLERLIRVIISTKARDMVDLAFTLAIQRESYSVKRLVGYSTSIPLEISDSLFEVGGVSLGALLLQISFFSLICDFSAICPTLGQGLNSEVLNCRILLRRPFLWSCNKDVIVHPNFRKGSLKVLGEASHSMNSSYNRAVIVH